MTFGLGGVLENMRRMRLRKSAKRRTRMMRDAAPATLTIIMRVLDFTGVGVGVGEPD